MEFSQVIETASVWILPVLLAITLHEAAHGYVAWILGDDTAYSRGRVTLNPIKHVDPVGTVLLPGMLLAFGSPFVFGWAKPVPVAFGRLRNPKRDMILVAIAGPATNIFLALVAAFLFNILGVFPDSFADWLSQNLSNAVLINLVLAIFNMLPIPPLDGGRVLTGLLPTPLAIKFARVERFGFLILIGLIFILPMAGINLFAHLVLTPLRAILPWFELIANLW